MAHPRVADRRRRQQPGADRRDATSARRATIYFTNAVTEVVRRRERAASTTTRCSEESARRVPRRQHARAHVAQRDVLVALVHARRHARPQRRRIAVLDGEGADCTLNGLYLADGERLVDNHTTIDHAKPHCASHELYKGILAGKARAVFNGKIIVRQDAQKTDAKQTNQTLLLSDDAHDQHQAAARDLRRRREVHARRDDRPARRRRALLPARARPDAAPRRATC